MFCVGLAAFDPAEHRIEVHLRLTFTCFIASLPVIVRLQLPGLYSFSADRPPDVAGLEYVRAVDRSLLVMGSARRPKRVTLYGSSGSAHRFLVKGGEDLRNDERVQLLFGCDFAARLRTPFIHMSSFPV